MRVVEFVGLPGAGKSTVSKRLISLIRDRGNPCFSRDEALWRALARKCDDRLCRGLFRFLPDSYTRKRAYSIFCRSLDRFKSQCRFVAKHKSSLAAILDSDQFQIMSQQYRATVLRWFLIRAAVYQVISEQTDENPIVILDEGFVQRSMSLFVLPGHPNSEFDPTHARRYIESVPQSDLVVFIDVDPETCLTRIRVRPEGMPRRFRDIDSDGVKALFREAQEYFRDILSANENVVHISNNVAIKTAVLQISRRLDSLGPHSAKHVPDKSLDEVTQ